MTSNSVPTLPSGIARRYLSVILGFGVAAGLSAAPFLGAKRIPGFEPLIAIFPEENRDLLIPASSFLIGLIALAVQFYAGEPIARRNIRKGFAVMGLIVLVAMLSLLVLYVKYVKLIFSEWTGQREAVVIGWSRLPSPPCGCPANISHRACIEGLGIGGDITSCWREESIDEVQLSLFLSYLVAIEGFAVAAGLLVLRPDKPTKRQKPKKTAKRRRTGKSPPPAVAANSASVPQTPEEIASSSS